jgi:Guanylate-binding protein, N-terminal domain
VEPEDDKNHPHGDPVSLMSIIKDTVNVDYKKIESTFDHPEVADRKIVAVSVIGALRKGKSFLMAYCLRFMYANVSEISLITKFFFNFINDTTFYLVQVSEFHEQHA